MIIKRTIFKNVNSHVMTFSFIFALLFLKNIILPIININIIKNNMGNIYGFTILNTDSINVGWLFFNASNSDAGGPYNGSTIAITTNNTIIIVIIFLFVVLLLFLKYMISPKLLSQI